MNDRYEIRLAGTGGQGLLLAGLMLAEAAALYEGKNVVQTQTYGAVVRGGTSKSEIIISDGPIDYPFVIQADLLLAMSQGACDRYAAELKEGGLLIVDTDHVGRLRGRTAIRAPITSLAQAATGKVITANVVGLGLIVGLTGIVSRQSIEQAVAARAPKGTAEINLQALAAGFAEAERLTREQLS